MESRFRTRISRMFSSSLGSCGSQNLSEAMRRAVISPKNKRGLTKIEPLSPKCKPYPSICKPTCPENEYSSGHEVSDKFLHHFHAHFDIQENKMRPKQTNKKKSRNIKLCPSSSSQPQYTNFSAWTFSSTEDETETLFSSKSVSSTSPEPNRRRTCRRKRVTRRRRAAGSLGEAKDVTSGEKVKDSFAVVKQSSDPYNDFRTSMVEMIVEKQIVAAKDLEQLLQCFLSLNSYSYHRIIVEVFIEICETLIHNCS